MIKIIQLLALFNNILHYHHHHHYYYYLLCLYFSLGGFASIHFYCFLFLFCVFFCLKIATLLMICFGFTKSRRIKYLESKDLTR